MGVSSVTVRPVRGSVFVQKLAHMAQRGPVVGRRRREQSERFAVVGGPCGQTQFDDAVGDALGCRVAYALAQLADARTAAA